MWITIPLDNTAIFAIQIAYCINPSHKILKKQDFPKIDHIPHLTTRNIQQSMVGLVIIDRDVQTFLYNKKITLQLQSAPRSKN